MTSISVVFWLSLWKTTCKGRRRGGHGPNRGIRLLLAALPVAALVAGAPARSSAAVTAPPAAARAGGAPAAAAATPRAGSTAADRAAAGPLVRYDHGRLTVHAAGVPAGHVLDRIAAETGAAIRGTPRNVDVTVDVDDAALSDALAAVLGGQSFMLTYGSDGVLRAIDLLAAGPAAPLASVSAAPALSSTPSGALAEAERQAAILRRPVHVSGALARALGTDRPATGTLLHAAISERDPAVRAAARDALLATFRADPEVEAAYLSTLTPVADATLATMLQGISADGAAELMAALASRARSIELRRKAASVLDALERLPARDGRR